MASPHGGTSLNSLVPFRTSRLVSPPGAPLIVLSFPRPSAFPCHKLLFPCFARSLFFHGHALSSGLIMSSSSAESMSLLSW